MTEERMKEIKKYTVGKAFAQLENVDFSDPTKAAFRVGKIMGELDNNLSKELHREIKRKEAITKIRSEKEEI